MNKKSGEVRLLKNGFSYPAFFFTYFWALYHKLWLPWFVAFSLQCVLYIMMTQYFPVVSKGFTWGVFSVLISFVLRSYFGFFGNDILRHKAEREGYTIKEDLIAARNSNEAVLAVMQYPSDVDLTLADYVTKIRVSNPHKHDYASQKFFWSRWTWGALLCLFVLSFNSYNLEFSTRTQNVKSIPVSSFINQSNLKMV
jgi:hypothetical protein